MKKKIMHMTQVRLYSSYKQMKFNHIDYFFFAQYIVIKRKEKNKFSKFPQTNTKHL